MSFWLRFAINEAILVAESFVAVSSLSDAQKMALQNFIISGQAVIASFTGALTKS